jgi:ParB/RepB/Spo0J family partition protein
MPTIQQVPTDRITAGLNDRETFNRSELEALAANIAANGLLQPPVYRPLADGTYQIIAGERRTRAMRDILAWPLIPAIVTDMSDEEAIAAMGSENRCRVQLNPLEEAKGYRSGMDRFSWDVATCASKNGVSTRTVNERLALLTLCPEAQDLISKKESGFTVGYALVLASAGLDRNFQNRALDLLKANRAPSLEWFRAQVSELTAACQSNSMFDLDAFMTGAIEAVQVQNETVLPDPDTAEAPTVGETAIDVLTNQAAWWRDLASQYTARGRKQEARICRANARQCAASADLLSRMAALASPPAPMAQAPDDPAAPMAPAPSELPPGVIDVTPLEGRIGRRVCKCGKRAQNQVVKRITTDGQSKRTILEDTCNDCCRAQGITPPGAAFVQQLTFQAVAAA